MQRILHFSFRLLAVLYSIATASITAQAQPAQQQSTIVSSDLRALIVEALAHSPRLREAEKNVQASAIRQDIAQTGYLPIVSAHASVTHIAPFPEAVISTPFGESRFAPTPQNSYGFAVNVGETVYDFGKTATSMVKAQADHAVVLAGFDNAKLATQYQVAVLYYAIVFIHKSIAVQDTQIALLEETLRVIASRVRNGDALDYDIIATKVRLDNLKNRKLDLTNSLAKNYATLRSMIGHDVVVAPQALPIALALAESGVPYSEQGLQSNKDLQVATKRVLAAEQDIAVGEHSQLPAITAGISAGMRNGILPVINDFRFNYALSVGFAWNIFTGGRDKMQTQIAQVNQEASKYALQGAQESLRRDYDLVASDMTMLTEKLRNSESQIQQAQQGLKLAQTRYSGGVITNLELQSAQAGVLEAELSKLQVEYQIVLSALEFKRLRGDTFE